MSVELPDRPGTFNQLYELVCRRRCRPPPTDFPPSNPILLCAAGCAPQVYPRNITELSYRVTHAAANEITKLQDGTATNGKFKPGVCS